MGVSEISRATDDQTTSAQHVFETADKLSNVSDQTSVEAQSVSAAAQQQASAVAEVSDDVQHLAERTDDLETLLEAFTVRRGAQADTAGAGATGPAVTDGGDTPGRSD